MDGVSDYVIVGVVLLILVAVWIGMMVIAGRHPQESTALFRCAPGQCPTNLFTGEKRCPSDDTTALLYNASFETCNSRYTCESPQTPFALNADGSTNINGVCEASTLGQPKVPCRCLAHPQCGIETLVVFSQQNGSVVFQDPTLSRAIFTQTPLTAQGNTQTPLSFTDVNTQFCAIKADHLNRLAPGACVFGNPVAPTTQEVRQCIQANPCLIGIMAFKPTTVNSFSLSATNTTALATVPVGCVPGATIPTAPGGCGGTTVPVWNPSIAGTICYDVGV